MACNSAVISGNRANHCICAQRTSGIATNSNHIWNIPSRDITYLGTPNKCGTASKFIWAKFLCSWRKHIQENQTYGRLPAHQQSSAGLSPRKRAGRAQKYPSLIELTPFEEVTQAARSKPRLCWWCRQHSLTHLFIPAKLLTSRQELTTVREAQRKVFVVYCEWQLVSLSVTRVGDAANFFFFGNEEGATPQLEEDPGEPSGVDERPCSMRPMRHKGKSWYRQFIRAHISVWTPPTGKDKLKEPRESWDPVWTQRSLLWIKLIFVSRACTVKVGFMFWFCPSPRWI